ncbi:MipA/OmpV family protein [Solilutibacter silvestris]|uniref:MipA/OmpV family protein n=1 Tax=Solilutibacter silvestris TaxID=1645665 RepID=UPI003D32A977
MNRFPRPFLLAITLAGCSLTAQAQESPQASDAPVYAVGAGVQRLPAWLGAKHQRTQAVPFFDIELPGKAELSSVDGLTVDIVRGKHWHGGVYADIVWGRSRGDLGPQLSPTVKRINDRLAAGGYLENEINKTVTIGGRAMREIGGNGAYADLYTDITLPKMFKVVEHGFEFSVRAANAASNRERFGLDATQASQLNLSPTRPGASWQQASLQYQIFVPTSQHTGIAANIEYARLLGEPARSPLVKSFGQRNQLSEGIAFVYHF